RTSATRLRARRSPRVRRSRRGARRRIPAAQWSGSSCCSSRVLRWCLPSEGLTSVLREMFVGSILVAREQRQEVLLKPVGVVDDVAAGREQARWFSLPACVSGECEVGVPDDVPGPAETAERAVREPLAGESGSVPEADDAGIVEDVRVPGAAG